MKYCTLRPKTPKWVPSWLGPKLDGFIGYCSAYIPLYLVFRKSRGRHYAFRCVGQRLPVRNVSHESPGSSNCESGTEVAGWTAVVNGSGDDSAPSNSYIPPRYSSVFPSWRRL